ncbi:MAG: hypothetical protein GXO79_13640 [Chlorobi bacterium]|nr:hypothetical protein [Chlorobiota bacterium]
MTDKNNKIFGKSECISSENLKRYAKNELFDKEKRKVEKHLIDCKMCSDELEGIEKFETIDKLEDAEYSIRNKIIFKYGHLKTKANITSIIAGIAASVLLAIVSGYIIMFVMHHYEKKEIAQQLELKSSKSEMIQKEEAMPKVESTTKSYTGKLKKTLPEEPSKTSPENGIVPVKTARQMVIIDNNEKDLDIAEPEKVLNDEITTLDVEEEQEKTEVTAMAIHKTKRAVQPATKSVSPEYIANEVFSKEEAMPVMGSVRNYNLAQMGKMAFEQHDYKNAKQIIETAFSQGIQTDSLIYYYSVACYKLNLPDSTINYLNKLKNPKLFNNGAKWFMANSYLIKNKRDKAILLLKEIIQDNTGYSSEAREKLSEISGNE